MTLAKRSALLTCSGLYSTRSQRSAWRQVLGLAQPVSAQARSADLVADGGFGYAKSNGHLGLVMTRFHQGVNLVTLLLGEPAFGVSSVPFIHGGTKGSCATAARHLFQPDELHLEIEFTMYLNNNLCSAGLQ